MKARIETDGTDPLRSSNKSKLNVRGSIKVTVQVGDLVVPVQFGVIHGLVITLLFGTKFINKHIRTIDPNKRRIVPNNASPVAIMAIGDHEATVVNTFNENPYGLNIHPSELIITVMREVPEDT